MVQHRVNAPRGVPAWIIWVGGLLAVVLLALLAGAMEKGTSAPAGLAVPASRPAPPSPAPVAVVIPSPILDPAPAPAVALPPVVSALGPGATGPAVVAFQQRLAALSYLVGPANGTFGSATGYAVTAFQKVQGLPRTGVIDGPTQAALETATVPTAAYSSPPDHLEVDIGRQVLFVVAGGQVTATVAVSTGTDKKFYEQGSTAPHKAVTPNGVFTVLWKHNGWWTSPLGKLYKPSFIDDTLGIAIHGYPEVPPEPASHGCIRVPMPFADQVYAQYTAPGTTVIIHGGPDGPNP